MKNGTIARRNSPTAMKRGGGGNTGRGSSPLDFSWPGCWGVRDVPHELTITVESPDGVGWINVPTIFPGQLPGLDPAKPQTLTDAHRRRATERAYALSRLGVKFRAFPSISEAVEAARQASEAAESPVAPGVAPLPESAKPPLLGPATLAGEPPKFDVLENQSLRDVDAEGRPLLGPGVRDTIVPLRPTGSEIMRVAPTPGRRESLGVGL